MAPDLNVENHLIPSQTRHVGEARQDAFRQLRHYAKMPQKAMSMLSLISTTTTNRASPTSALSSAPGDPSPSPPRISSLHAVPLGWTGSGASSGPSDAQTDNVPTRRDASAEPLMADSGARVHDNNNNNKAKRRLPGQAGQRASGMSFTPPKRQVDGRTCFCYCGRRVAFHGSIHFTVWHRMDTTRSAP